MSSFEYSLKLTENNNVIFSFKNPNTNNTLYHKVEPEHIEFFRDLFRNIHNLEYVNSVKSHTFSYGYGYEDMRIIITVNDTCSGIIYISDIETIKKLAEDIVKKFEFASTQ